MLITFRSQASGDVMMFDDVARHMLRIIGKEPADKGIITVAQLPDAIAALKGAIAADKAERPERSASGRVSTETEPDSGQDLFVSASQRAQPLLEQLEWSLKADKPVLWDV
jgi:uncharacterized small protein (DUF1192 family)